MSYPEKRDGDHTGRWVGQVRFGDDPPFRAFFDSKAEADAYEAYVKESRSEPPWVASRTKATGALFTDVLDECEAAGGNKGTWITGRDPAMAQRLKFVKAFYSGHPIGAIDTAALNRLVKRLRATGVTTATINRYLDAVSAVLTYAHQSTPPYITHKPKVPRQKETGRRVATLTDAEELQLCTWLEACGQHRYAIVIRFLAAFGLRRGEYEQLQPRQITCGKVQGVVEIWPEQTKTGEGRVVHGPVEYAEEMRRLILTSQVPKGYRLLRVFKQAVEKCGLDDRLVVHSLRHTCCTRLIRAGVPTRIVQQIMGHSTITTTERYAHVDEKMLVEAAEKRAHSRGLEAGVLPVGHKNEVNEINGLEATPGIEPGYAVLQTAP